MRSIEEQTATREKTIDLGEFSVRQFRMRNVRTEPMEKSLNDILQAFEDRTMRIYSDAFAVAMIDRQMKKCAVDAQTVRRGIVAKGDGFVRFVFTHLFHLLKKMTRSSLERTISTQPT